MEVKILNIAYGIKIQYVKNVDIIFKYNNSQFKTIEIIANELKVKMKKIILNIINKISYMIYLISVLSISVFLLMYIFTDDIKFIALVLVGLILTIVFGKLYPTLTKKLLDCDTDLVKEIE